MRTIHLLQDEVINKIAAGEVVERPASVIKELVENSLDAEASIIRIELKQGGTKEIVVTDNGGGIAVQDAPLVLARHATSKIQGADDLFQIASFGFRGEALAAIAAVSRFTLMSRRGEGDGFRLVGDNDTVTADPWFGDVGTVIKVQDLFYNIPVRAKFLRSPAAEFAHCLEWVQGLALGAPHVELSLVHNGKTNFLAPAIATDEDSGLWHGEALLQQRFKAVCGDRGPLIYLKAESRFGRIEGLFSPPGVERSTTKDIHLYVNRRAVKDKVLRYGVLHGYHGHLLKGKFPVALCYVTIDPSLVDVNVHPAKTELRFQYAKEVQDLISFAVRDQLRAGAWAAPPPKQVQELEPAKPEPAWIVPTNFDLGPERVQVAPSPMPWQKPAPTGPASYRAERFDGPKPPPFAAPVPRAVPLIFAESQPKPRPSALPWASLRFIGSFAKCYLLFEDEDRLLVVDQHAFHERILYERLLNDRAAIARSQPLLVPEAIELSPTAAARMVARQSELEPLGFKFIMASATTLEVKAVPVLLMRRDLDAVIQSLAGVDGEASASTAESTLSGTLATLACHGAVRAGEDLEASDLKHLLREAGDVDFYLNCPHGRPVFKWWDQSAVGGWFHR